MGRYHRRERLGRKKGKMGKEFTSRNNFFPSLFAFCCFLSISSHLLTFFFVDVASSLSFRLHNTRRRWGTVKFRKMIQGIFPTLLYTCTNFSSSSFDGLAIVWRGSHPLCYAILRSVLDTKSSGRSTPQELKFFMLNSLFTLFIFSANWCNLDMWSLVEEVIRHEGSSLQMKIVSRSPHSHLSKQQLANTFRLLSFTSRSTSQKVKYFSSSFVCCVCCFRLNICEMRIFMTGNSVLASLEGWWKLSLTDLNWWCRE